MAGIQGNKHPKVTPFNGGLAMPISELLGAAHQFGRTFLPPERSMDHLKENYENAAHLLTSITKVLSQFRKLAKGNKSPAVSDALEWLKDVQRDLEEISENAKAALEIEINKAVRHG